MAGKSSNLLLTFVLLLGFVVFDGCGTVRVGKPLRIALSSGTENYVNWIHRGDSLAETVDLKGMDIDSALKILGSCDAILFTGGEDVVPAYYGKDYDSARCETNPGRDSLEFALIKECMRLKMPVFGVCRGQQILNVALGGTLVVDIPADRPGNVIHRCEDYTRCFHPVALSRGSRLHEIARADSGPVTTNHHQAVDKPAPGMAIVARSADSIAEAMEWQDPKGKAFFMTVQWHPERMDTLSPLSMPLVRAFLDAAEAFRKQK
jgi:putative glutamine amidotransferase